MTPTPAEIRAAREAAGMTQTAAGAAALATLRTWQDWESGRRAIHPAAWAVFRHRTGQRPIAVDLAPTGP